MLSFKRALLASVGPGLILGIIGAASARAALRVTGSDRAVLALGLIAIAGLIPLAMLVLF